MRQPETVEHIFDSVWAGTTVKHTFEVSNTSQRMLGIQRVSTSCGCTTTGKWDKQVPPGQTWKLNVELSTLGRRGQTTKTFVVTTDDPDRPEIHLVLKGKIQPRFEFSPDESISFGPLQAGSTAKRTIRITNRFTDPIVLSLAQAQSKTLKASLRQIEKGQVYELDVETVPPLPERAALGSIVLQTDLKEQPQLVVPVYGQAMPRVMLAPKVMMVAHPVRRQVQRILQLVLADGTSADVTKVETSNPAIVASPEPRVEGRPQVIRIWIAEGSELRLKGETISGSF